ncbi:MAG TPA: aspartyl/asparaginyl beta-hydroxylase domain-containing protein [Planctomycetota bacterium]|nr:aspartyl/asparaginyl beta-hydroxylase domain-containing protein [Planctomycetota bacterium]
MLLAADQFAFTVRLEAGFALFQRELRQLVREDFDPWPDPGAFGGEWLTLPLFLASHPARIDRHFARNQAKCPLSTEFLSAIPSVVSAGFSWMESGCHIYPHVDAKPLNVLRAHLGLEVPDGSLMRVGADQHTWREGRVLVFDGFVEHETANTAATRRVVLLVDAVIEGGEFDSLQAWRQEHGVDLERMRDRGVVM